MTTCKSAFWPERVPREKELCKSTSLSKPVVNSETCGREASEFEEASGGYRSRLHDSWANILDYVVEYDRWQEHNNSSILVIANDIHVERVRMNPMSRE